MKRILKFLNQVIDGPYDYPIGVSCMLARIELRTSFWVMKGKINKRNATTAIFFGFNSP